MVSKIEGKQLLMRMVCAAVFVTIATASAKAAVPTYTGCYNASSGTVNKLALGFNPQKACANTDMLVSFAAGDITKISVTGGLTGGGDNGDITISLDPKYSLPQSCGTNQVAKWNGSSWLCANDEDTTYGNGTGLALSGSNQFSILPAYRLPQSCSDGSIAKLSGDTWACAALSAGPEVWVTTKARQDIGEDAGFVTVASLSLPAGSYVVHASTTAERDEADSGRLYMACNLTSDATDYPQAPSVSSYEDDAHRAPLVINGVITLPSTRNINLRCFGGGEPGQHVSNAILVAIKAGTVHVQ